MHIKVQYIPSEHEGITVIVNIIHYVTTQYPPKIGSEHHKIGQLSTAEFDFSWSEIIRSNVLSLKYFSNQFVTVLHAQVNLEEMNRWKHESNRSISDGIYVWSAQYARNGKLFSRQNGKDIVLMDNDECFNWGYRPWKQGQKFKPGAIRNSISKKLHNGTSAVHIMSMVVQLVESDMNSKNDQREWSDDKPPTIEAWYFDSMVNAGKDEEYIENFEEAYLTFHFDTEVSKPKIFKEHKDLVFRQSEAYERCRQNNQYLTEMKNPSASCKDRMTCLRFTYSR